MITLTSGNGGNGRRLSRPTLLVAFCLSLLTGGTGEALIVDAELVLLVDNSVVVDATDFGELLEGYAQAFESGAIIDSLQTGVDGIAASLILFGDVGTEVVAVPWMHITDSGTAGDFADAIRGVTQPAGGFFSSIATGLEFATEQFGSETGNSGNGFESKVQAINLTTETVIFPAEGPGVVVAARDAALADGVDVINGITVGTFLAAESTTFYETNVVAGIAGGVSGGVENSSNGASLPTVATTSLAGQIINMVPEPGTLMLLFLGVWPVVLRRRQ